ncbi:MAG: hypothetical protein HY074_11315 [Deltaproteobacteria bacterium]|nr:hypothetical protein [Deltaproteobacteria bacterium]
MKHANPMRFCAILVLLPVAAGTLQANADEVAQGFLLMNMGAATAPGSGAKTMDYNVGLGQRDPGGNGGRVQQSLGGRVGWGDRSSIAAHGILGNNNNSGASAEIATLLYKPASADDFSLSAAGGWQTVGGIQHARARAALDKRWGAISASVQALLDHQFQSGTDGVDYFVAAGVSYALTQAFALGAEYLGQDLESVTLAQTRQLFAIFVAANFRIRIGRQHALGFSGFTVYGT